MRDEMLLKVYPSPKRAMSLMFAHLLILCKQTGSSILRGLLSERMSQLASTSVIHISPLACSRCYKPYVQPHKSRCPHEKMGTSLIPTLLPLDSTGYSRLV